MNTPRNPISPFKYFGPVSVVTFLVLSGSAATLLRNHRRGQTITGVFASPEISGASMVGDRLLVVSDDPEQDGDPIKKFNMVGLVANAKTRLSGQTISLSPEEQVYHPILTKIGVAQADDASYIADIEDVAVAPDGSAYLMTSHSQSKKGKSPAKRSRLVRVRFDSATGKVTEAKVAEADLLSLLPESLKLSTKRRPGTIDSSGKPDPGFNIEGVALSPSGDLLLGLRSPTNDSKAIVLKLAHVDSLFDRPTDPVQLTVLAELNLGGQGIRGMNYDAAKGCFWILSGLSSDPDVPVAGVDWSVWSWDGVGSPKKRLSRSNIEELKGIDNAEAISTVKMPGDAANSHLLIIGDADAGKPSPYAVLPLSKLAP